MALPVGIEAVEHELNMLTDPPRRERPQTSGTHTFAPVPKPNLAPRQDLDKQWEEVCRKEEEALQRFCAELKQIRDDYTRKRSDAITAFFGEQ